MKASKNLEMLALVARGLRELKDSVVFVGGATVDMYVADSAAEPLRATDDVDCVVALMVRTICAKRSTLASSRGASTSSRTQNGLGL